MTKHRSFTYPGIAALWFSAIAGLVQGYPTFVETFDGGSNEGGWAYGTGNEVIEPAGGNPGAYLHDSVVDTFAPQPATAFAAASIFTGNLRGRDVTSIGIDLITHSVNFSAEGRPLSLLLVSDNGTPGNFDDDWAAYFIGPDNIPLPGQGWLEYDFAVPTQETTLPAGWNMIAFGPDSPPNPEWNDLVIDVAQIRYFYGDPTLFFIFQQWNVGLDNPRITATQCTCQLYGDIVNVKAQPIPDCQVDVTDIICVLDDFVDSANCAAVGDIIGPNGSCAADGVYDVNDITAELAAFVGTPFCPDPCPP